MPRLRVLVLDHTAQEGGAEIALLRLAEALQAAGDVDVRTLLFAEGPLGARLSSAGIPTSVLALDEGIATTSRDHVIAGAARSAVGAIRFIPVLVRAIRSSGADFVVANSLKSAVFAFVAAPLAGRPWVWHLHDRLAPDYLPVPLVVVMRRIAAAGPRAIVVNSRATLATLPRRARRKTVVAYPGLPAQAFARAESTPAEIVVGLIGRISPTKGQREFLDAAAIVAAARPDVRFVVIGGSLFGEDEYEARLHGQVARLDLGERVEFAGWVPDTRAPLRRLTLLVHASPVPEPFGQVVVEAMAAGVPVVATAAGGVIEILDPDDPGTPLDGWRPTATGTLVAPGDSAALAAAIVATLGDAGRRARATDAAHADAKDRFTIERTAETIRPVWRRSSVTIIARCRVAGWSANLAGHRRPPGR